MCARSRSCAPHGHASSASQSELPVDAAGPCDESGGGTAVATLHAMSWALSHSDSGALASCAGEAGTEPIASGDGTAARNSAAAADATARRKPLTLERLREQTPALAGLDMSVLQQRLSTLCGLLQLDDTACLMLCRIVTGLLLVPPSALRDTWDRLCIVLGGEEPTRAACTVAPLLLVLPSHRVPTCIASLTAATAMPRAQAAALVVEWPQLATHAPASLAAKLEGLRELLQGPSSGSGTVGTSSGGSAASAPVLRAALRMAPRLLTFSTAALARHHAELKVLLGPERLSAALRREPGLLLQRPSTVAAKMALLQQLMDCAQHPAAVAAIVVRQPGVLRRSLAALSRCCRALSVWRLCRRDKLRMCLSRPRLLTLPPEEVHGRCRWLRRLMLSNAYYHSALRRLPPSLVGALVAALPLAWARLLYLAESSQECRMHLMDAVECRQEDFAARFPEFSRWLQFKIKLMGADNPWRGTHRIRGFTTARDKLTHGVPQVKLRQRQQQQRRFPRLSQRQQYREQQQLAGNSVSVVLAEAGEVRSGGSTVARPRRVLRQLSTAVSEPPPERLPSSSGLPRLLPTPPSLPLEPDQAAEGLPNMSPAVLISPPAELRNMARHDTATGPGLEVYEALLLDVTTTPILKAPELLSSA
ncbi:hypothetical protein VOLCADRAFT_107585 [Volvox carteri f. nagariensis]|uniref:Uncharacterized protein n=1 Tax=Volvox carteri f. nagariensis TaxID=3068 RepID=D8UEU0_VOLCA|nr:uncharacterized protein VOLCADRAFT_107585 [Volvox carteri f. nagariensis]EFJ41742.1 hypothetical protein VOLCADRAFT_107585 [Volvox carteri f. nagariensis]|eukprot:XP_002957244.1 hypothetical protein VOLCADRAFT_107585 [Volvox carteri f. nagariensis]